MMNNTIVVLGASRGIGEELVKLLAQDPKNKIIALSRNLDKMIDSFIQFDNVIPLQFDLNQDQVRSNAEKSLINFDRIDFLINNAGYLVNKKFGDLTHEDFISSYQTNVIGIMEFVQAVVPKMTKGHIVNISSMGGFQGTMKFPGLTAYSTSKAALTSFTEMFAEEFKETDIKMNCLCLGAAQTEMLNEAFPGFQAPLSAEKMAEYIVEFTLNAHQWMHGKIIPVALTTP